jgi:DNA processing protein
VIDAVESSAVAERWRHEAREIDAEALWEEHRAARVGVIGQSSPAFPMRLLDDPEPPIVLFTSGDPTVFAGRTAAIVGTRQCTRYGIDIAHELGRMLAGAGVSVVSGLAAGIDAAAHAGAIAADGAPPIGVVGSGVDRPYPARNRALWRRVGETGVICSEAPLGAAPRRWRFPARNRLIAGLAELVVVVESHTRGGSLSTATEAMARDRPVLAVPGSIRSPASAGTNRLIDDGCTPLCVLDDVMVALDLIAAPTTAVPAPTAVVDAASAALLDILGWQPRSVDEVVVTSGAAVDDTALRIERLIGSGLVVRRGSLIERTAQVFRVDEPPS